MQVYTILFLAGLLGGFLAGLLGIGGGLIYVIALSILFHYLDIDLVLHPELIIANSIFAIFFASAAASITLIRQKQFYLKEVLLVAIGSVLASIITLRFLVHTPWYSLRFFNLVLIVLLLYMLFRLIKRVNSKQIDYHNKSKVQNRIAFLGSGVAGGLIAALSGLGGGVVIVPIINTFLKVDIKKTKSISLGVILITSLLMTIYNAFEEVYIKDISHVGLLIPNYTLLMVLGVVFGSPLGVKVSDRWSEKKITLVYSIFLVLFLIKKIIELL